MGKFIVLSHPLIQHKLIIVREKDTGTNEFRRIVGEIGGLMVCGMTRDLPLKNVEIEAPIGRTTQKGLASKKLVIVPVLRVGLGTIDGVLQMIPSAKVGHIGVHCDEETLKPYEYFFEMPQDIEERNVIIVGPILAADGLANITIDALKRRGTKNARLAVSVAAPEGVKNIQEVRLDVDIYAATEDEKLMDNDYIFPGLGGAGDRLFGTK